MWRNWKTCALLVVMSSGIANAENNIEGLQKVKHITVVRSSNSTSWYISKRIENSDSDIYIPLFTGGNKSLTQR